MMNTRPSCQSAILIALVIVFTIACNALTPFFKPTPSPLPIIPTATPVPKILHFENDMVAFDYPAGLVVFNAADPAFIPYPSSLRLGGQLVAGLADPDEIGNDGTLYRTLGIFRQPIPPDSNLESVMETAYSPIQRTKGYLDATGPVKLAGLPAYQQTYSYFDYGTQSPYEMRDIWTEKDNMIFRVSAWTPPHNPESFAAFQSLADDILNSLVIKENLPPVVETPETPTPEPTLTPTPFPASMLRHYENDVMAFDYLKGMNFYDAGDSTFQCYPDFQLGGEMVVGLGDPKFTGFGNYYRSIRIFRQPMPSGSNLETVMLDAYRQVEDKFPRDQGEMDATGPVTVAGLSAFQWTYQVHSGEAAYELRDVWIPKDGELFIITIWTEYTNPDDFTVFQASADLLLKSLHIK
jgi:hypothetical protein